jgi:hypothetical protein
MASSVLLFLLLFTVIGDSYMFKFRLVDEWMYPFCLNFREIYYMNQKYIWVALSFAGSKPAIPVLFETHVHVFPNSHFCFYVAEVSFLLLRSKK